jgi:hypothetical protein
MFQKMEQAKVVRCAFFDIDSGSRMPFEDVTRGCHSRMPLDHPPAALTPALKPACVCDAISVVAEFMVDVADLKAACV